METKTKKKIIIFLIIFTPFLWNKLMYIVDSYYTSSLTLYIAEVISTILGLLLLYKTLDS